MSDATDLRASVDIKARLGMASPVTFVYSAQIESRRGSGTKSIRSSLGEQDPGAGGEFLGGSRVIENYRVGFRVRWM